MTQDPTAPLAAPSPEAKISSSKDHAVKAAEDLKTAATQKAAEIRDSAQQHATEFKNYATDKAYEVRNYAEQRYDDARLAAEEYRVEGERYVRENPAKSVLIALGIGFVVGRILR